MEQARGKRKRVSRETGFDAVVCDEHLPEMKWSRESKRTVLFAARTGTQKITVHVLVVYGLKSQLEMEEEKNEELHNACTRTVFQDG